MPAIIPADSNVTLEPPVTLPHSQSYPPGLLPPYSIYIAFAALAFFVVLRVAGPSLASRSRPAPDTKTQTNYSTSVRPAAPAAADAARECRKDYSQLVLARPSGSATGEGVGVTGGSAPSWNRHWTWTKPNPKAEGWQALTVLGVGVGAGVGGPGHQHKHQHQRRHQHQRQGQALHHRQEQAIRLLTGTGLADSSSSMSSMEQHQHHQRRSRGVSSRNNNAADLSQRLSFPAAGRNARRSASSSSSSPSSPPSISSSRRPSSDGAASGPRREQGTMDGDSWMATSPIDMNEQSHMSFASITTASQGGAVAAAAASGGAGGGFDFTTPRQFMARPPPPPPLTPPTLSGAIFTIDDRRRSYPHSIPAKLDAVSPAASSFIHQPNPDYVGSSSSAAMKTDAPSTTPRRRSYNKTLPIGIPVPQHSPSSPPTELPSATTDGFSPSSFPPTSPLLPPPPPGHHELALDIVDGHHQIGRDIDVQGEIISVLDDSGAGWKRHTRVYGGGVCLACVAAGGGGGFYGDTVRPEDRR